MLVIECSRICNHTRPLLLLNINCLASKGKLHKQNRNACFKVAYTSGMRFASVTVRDVRLLLIETHCYEANRSVAITLQCFKKLFSLYFSIY